MLQMKFRFLVFSLTAVCALAFTAVAVRAQETGGDLVGGAGIFRPKNPEAKRSGNANRPTRPRLTPAEIEERFQDAISDGNDARDARKFDVAEASYRAALKLKPQDARGFQGLGNVFVDQQRWEDAENAYRKAVDYAATNPDALMALSFVLVQPRTGALNAKRFADAEYFAKRATQGSGQPAGCPIHQPHLRRFGKRLPARIDVLRRRHFRDEQGPRLLDDIEAGGPVAVALESNRYRRLSDPQVADGHGGQPFGKARPDHREYSRRRERTKSKERLHELHHRTCAPCLWAVRIRIDGRHW